MLLFDISNLTCVHHHRSIWVTSKFPLLQHAISRQRLAQHVMTLPSAGPVDATVAQRTNVQTTPMVSTAHHTAKLC